MSTQLAAIVVVIGLALAALGMAWFAVAAAMLSSEISQSEERASANGDYLADETEHDDG